MSSRIRFFRSMLRKKEVKALLIALISAGFLGMGGILVWSATLAIPDLNSFETLKIEQSTKFYDRTGKILLYDLHEDVRRTVVPFSDMSYNVKNATVAIEDDAFYTHHGIKPTAIIRAVFANTLIFLHLSNGYTQGGSTITQQVVKNSVLTNDKTITRKIKEWILALKLERALTKEQILELYLNEVPYGGNLYGIEEASMAYFGKHASEVSLAESAYLAALPQAPSYYSPYGNHRDALEERKNLVLKQMLKNNFITEEAYQEALNEKVEFQPFRDGNIKAAHFVFYVRQYLAEKYGDRAVELEGLKVTTTLDANLQNMAQDIVQKYALENVEKFKAENAGMVAIDPHTGQILVMVGSRNYFDDQIDGNFNVTLAKRQPGSSFKPFVYATALSKGYTPETIVFDTPTQFSTNCAVDNLTSEDGCYSPVNYDAKYRGPITFRNALAQSVNIPAIQVLYLAGIKDSIETARGMGITTLTDPNRYGLTLVLGGGEVTLLEMTGAYATFAQDGMYRTPTGILKIEDRDGNVLEEYHDSPRQALNPQVAREISDMLSDNDARTPAFGSNSYLYFPGREVAVKTGTTNDYRDAWILGYTPSIAVGAWAGNNDNSPMVKQVAGLIVAPLWNAFMQEALKTVPIESFPLPTYDTDGLKPIMRGIWQGGETYTVDKVSGKLATDATPEDAREERVVPNVHSILYWVDKDNPLGPVPTNPSKDPQFKYWEAAVERWKASQGITDVQFTPPSGYDDVHQTSDRPRVDIRKPNDGSSFDSDERVSVELKITHAHPITHVDYFINDVYVATRSNDPFDFSFTPKEINAIADENRLRVVVHDDVFNKTEATLLFSVTH